MCVADYPDENWCGNLESALFNCQTTSPDASAHRKRFPKDPGTSLTDVVLTAVASLASWLNPSAASLSVRRDESGSHAIVAGERSRGSAGDLSAPELTIHASHRFGMARNESACCPIALTATLIGDRWTPLIVRDLASGGRRFSELQRSLAGISPKSLSVRLRRLEEAGVVTRSCFAEMPPRVEYRLTDKGSALLAVIQSMRDFGVTWLSAGASRDQTG
jgi:DNA-binding HxlR family transcriptional regulator